MKSNRLLASALGALPLLLAATWIGEGEGTVPRVAAADTVPVADLHVHLSSPAAAELLNEMTRMLDSADVEPEGPPAVARTADDALTALDRAGIERALVLSNAYMYGMPEVGREDAAPEVRAENTFLAEEVALHPDRLVGACSVNPLADYAMDELEYCLEELALPVLKLHFANSDLDLRNGDHRRKLREVFSKLTESKAGAIVHMRTRAEDYGARDARLFIDDVLVRVPGVPIQLAHMTGWGGYDDATDAALGEFIRALRDGRLNPGRVTFGLGAVVFESAAAGADTAAAEAVRKANEQLTARIREIGPERVVYATDWPSWPPVADVTEGIAANVRLVRSALDLTPDEFAEVFSNAGLLDALPARGAEGG